LTNNPKRRFLIFTNTRRCYLLMPQERMEARNRSVGHKSPIILWPDGYFNWVGHNKGRYSWPVARFDNFPFFPLPSKNRIILK